MEYASKGVGNAGLTTGIIGTALGALNGMGGVTNVLGRPRSESDEPVTRYEADMMMKLSGKDQEIALLKADKYTDQKIANLAERVDRRFDLVEQQIGQQAVYNATNNGMISCMQNQIAQLQSLTQLIVPNSHVMPGWGNVNITPATSGSNGTTNG